MKPQKKILFCLLAYCLLFFPSCMKEVGLTEQDQEVTILISTGERQTQTRASDDEPIDPLEKGNHTNDPDYKIGTLRILAFYESDGVLHRNSGKFTPPDNPQFMTLKTGRYHFVFIANEERDPALSQALEAMTEESSTYAEIMALKVDHSAFNSIQTGGGSSDLIPKIAVKGHVLVSKRKGQIKIFDPEENQSDPVPNTDATPWEVSLTQMGVRIDLTLEINDLQLTLYNTKDPDKFKITLSDIPENVDLLGKHNYIEGHFAPARTLGTPEVDVDNKKLIWKRIILPETHFYDKSTKEKGILITAWLNGHPFTARLYYEEKNESGAMIPIYALRRGIQLKIEDAIISATDITFGSVTVQEWGDAINGGAVEL